MLLSINRLFWLGTFAIACIAIDIDPVSADWRDDVGHTKLANELGAALPTGAGVDVAMAEAPAGGAYLPDAASPNFGGKTITDLTGTSSAPNGHATGVGNLFFGNTTSIAPGVTNVFAYNAVDWLNNVTGQSTTTAPAPHPYSVMNHSYIADAGPGEEAEVEELSKRIDFLVNRDNVLMVAGTNNGATNPLPDLLSGSYNSMIVGRTDGQHAHGTTGQNGTGLQRPDIVAPASSTSSSTPMVASAAALLYEAGAGTAAATNVEAMRAILMAGATKDEFSSWDRTTTRPIDETFGAGELNVYNSYQILSGGEFDGSTVFPTTPVGMFGYDFNSPSSFSSDYLYRFEVDGDQVLDELSIFLQWNIDVVDTDSTLDGFSPSTDPLMGGGLADLNLALFDSTNTLIDQSISSVDNFEHLYLTGLGAGAFTLHVSGDRAVDYGLAWRGSLSPVAVPEPSSLAFASTAVAIGIARSLRRRRRKTF